MLGSYDWAARAFATESRPVASRESNKKSEKNMTGMDNVLPT